MSTATVTREQLLKIIAFVELNARQIKELKKQGDIKLDMMNKKLDDITNIVINISKIVNK